MAGVTSTLQLEDRMTPVLRSVVKALESTLKAMANVDKVSNSAFNNASKSVQQASAQISNLNAKMPETVNNINKMGSSFNGVTNNVRNLTKEIGMLIGVYSGIQAIANIGKSADTYIGNMARLDLMNDGLQTTLNLQKQIYESSQRSASNYKETTAAVAKLGVTAGHAFNSSKEIVAFTELLNKQFQIGGASASEKAGAMYQLTQAMASGRLQGDEFRSILENAPMLMKAIRDYTGMTFAQLKEASTKGLITADLIKRSLFSIADETNKKFAEMPLKFGDLWTQILNKIDYGLQPLYIKLRGIYNNPEFQIFLTNMVNGFLNLISVTMDAFNVIAHLAAWTYDNWNIITPLIWGLVIALGAYAFAAKAVAVANGIKTFSEATARAATMLSTGATLAQTAAQYGLNAALYAFPGTWIVLAIIAIIAIIYVVIAAMNNWLGTTISVTAVIAAAVMGLVAILWNAFVALIEGCVQLVEFIANTVLSIWETVLNSLNGGFNSFGAFVTNLFNQLAIVVLDFFKIFSAVADAVLGTDWTNTLGKFQNALRTDSRYTKSNKFVPVSRVNLLKNVQNSGFGRMKYGESMRNGYNWGKKGFEKIKDTFRIGDKRYNLAEGMNSDLIKRAMETNGLPAAADAAKKTAKNTGKTAKNTKKTAKNTKKTADKLDKDLELSDKDVELLKESARVQFVNRFSHLAPQVTASFGDIHENADANGIIQMIEQSIQAALDAAITT